LIARDVFNIPGRALPGRGDPRRDYPIVQNLVMFIAIIVVTVNFIVDLLYAACDPRIKFASKWVLQFEDYDAELTRAGATRGFRRNALFLARGHPLGAIGALIMAIFVLAAIFADAIAPYDRSP